MESVLRCKRKLYFLIHPKGWINDERTDVHCLELGCIGLFDVHPFPPPIPPQYISVCNMTRKTEYDSNTDLTKRSVAKDIRNSRNGLSKSRKVALSASVG